MFRGSVVLGVCMGLSACAAPNNTSWWHGSGPMASSHESNQFSFQWQLVGDVQSAPLHVFNSSDQIWLQFPAGQLPPHVARMTLSAAEPVQLRQHGSYWVIDGRADVLRFQRDGQSAWAYQEGGEGVVRAAIQSELLIQAAVSQNVETSTKEASQRIVLNEHTGLMSGATQVEESPVETTVTESPSPDNTVVTALPVSVDGPLRIEPTASSTQHDIADVQGGAKLVSEPAVHLSSAPEKVKSFTAEPADRNLRQTLSRWAKEHYWTFEAEHWAVDVDLPITATFKFDGEFTDAVQTIVASTQLGTHPLKPCFYSNQVLRVIRLSQPCAPKALASDEVLS